MAKNIRAKVEKIDGVDYVVERDDKGKVISQIPLPGGTQPRELSRLDVLELFSKTELKAILAEAKTDPDIEVWLEKLRASTTVDLSAQWFIDGIQDLDTKGHINTGRAAEILGL